MDDRYIPAIIYDVLIPKGRYPEHLVLISQLEVCQKRGVKNGLLGGHFGFLTGDMDDRVIPDLSNDVLLLQRIYPDNLVLISQLEVCQEGGVKNGVTWRTLRVPDWRHG